MMVLLRAKFREHLSELEPDFCWLNCSEGTAPIGRMAVWEKAGGGEGEAIGTELHRLHCVKA